MDTQAQRQLAFSERVVGELLDAAKLIRFDRTDTAQLYAVALHATITELFAGCCAMLRAEHTAGIPGQVRSIYEALVDLDNLVRDADYHERMEAANLRKMLDLLAQADINPLFEGLGATHDVPTLREQFQSRLDELIAKGRGPLSIFDRCRLAGREHEYRTLYGLLCLDSHNNLAALADRHFDGDTTNELRVHVFGDMNAANVRRRMDFATRFALEAAQFIHEAFNTGWVDAKRLRHEHDVATAG